MVTTSHLEQLFFIEKEIILINRIIAEIEAEIKAYNFTSENRAILKILSSHLKRIIKQSEKANQFIDSIQYPDIKQAVILKYKKLYSWQKTARKSGSIYSPDTLRIVCKRYIEKHCND